MRMTRYLAAAATAAAAAALALAAPVTAADAATAPSGPVLTLSGVGGPPANLGDVLSAQLSPGTLLELLSSPGGGSGLFCQQSSWQGQLVSNPAVPGTAVIKLAPPLKISGCKDSNPTVTGVTGVTVNGLPALLQVTGATPYPLQILPTTAPLQIVVSLTTTTVPVVCTYQQATGVINGNTSLGSAPWSFTAQPFNLVGGPTGPCGPTTTDFLTASYSPVIDATAGGALVYVN